MASFSQRLDGYHAAMKAAGLKPWVIQAPDHEQLRYVLGAVLLSRKCPHALLSFSNRVSQSVLLTYDEVGIARGEHLPMLGFDDFELATLAAPPLSVVRQPTENMVRHAMNILFQRIEDKEGFEPQNITLSGELIYRQSCGCR